MELFFPGIPDNTNARSQWARFSANRKRQTIRESTAQAARPVADISGWRVPAFTIIHAQHLAAVHRRRDPTGLAERLKPILDGLVDAKILPDDDELHIRLNLLPSVSLKGQEPGIRILLEALHDDHQTAHPHRSCPAWRKGSQPQGPT